MPDWVRQAAQQTVGTLDPETKAVVLLDEFKYTIPGGDDIIERYRRVVKIVRKEGREEGDFSVWVSHQGKVLSVHGWSIDKAGHEYEIKDKDFSEKTPYSYVLYDDVHIRRAQVPAAEPGSIVAFEYEARRKVWIRELNWFFQEDNPVREARLILQLPAGWEYKGSWASAWPFSPRQHRKWECNGPSAMCPKSRSNLGCPRSFPVGPDGDSQTPGLDEKAISV